MKTKLAKKRFDEDLTRIRKVLNDVVFIEPPLRGKNFDEIAWGLIRDFIRSIQMSEMFGPCSTKKGEILIADIKSHETYLEIVQTYLELFRELCPTGSGFTPRLAVDSHASISGYNCLGKALAFGSYLTIHKILPKLVLSVEHAMCLVQDGRDCYLCDPGAGKMWKMHGTFFKNVGYGWYVASEEDEFHFHYLVIQPFTYGGLNAIFQTLHFLKEIGWRGGAISRKSFADYELNLFNIMDSQMGYREKICSIDWENFRGGLFKGMDDYKKKYAREWLLEGEYLRQRVAPLERRHQFDEAVFNAVRATHFKGKISDFHAEIIPLIKPLASHILDFLENRADLEIGIPHKCRIYFSTLKDLISKDPSLREYSISMIREKLLLDTVR